MKGGKLFCVFGDLRVDNPVEIDYKLYFVAGQGGAWEKIPCIRPDADVYIPPCAGVAQ
jgi:hypothetical protein